ncbi:hypothetical protein RB195_026170 [Necator americanus]|uniref:Ig-like domain-containing protein n=2 Tax=Necator americanus TaxID=51031 RepID=A0ABR1EY20_NECAM
MLITLRTRFGAGGWLGSRRGDGQAIPDPLPMRLAYLVMLVLYDQASSHIESCCRNRGVSEVCSRALCRLESPPGDIERYTIFEARSGCAQFLPEIAECIVDGRDSSECCQTNAVQADESSCLGLCRGSSDGTSHTNTPTPPQLIKIVSKASTSVEIQWSAPAKYSDLVHIYKVHVIETITTYASEEGPAVLVSALDIRALEDSDFGTYKCHVRGNSNDYGEIHLVAHSFAIGRPPLNPPETPLECCSRAVFRPHCHSVCHAGSERKRGLKPGSFLPQFRCLDEFQSLLRCTLSEMNSAGCCIRKKIPYHCLGMCDSNFELTRLIGSNCLEFESQVRQCQAEVLDLRPEAVSHLHTRSEADATILNWDRSDKAEVYHVYHRRRKGAWKSMSITKTTARVKNADEILVLAVNAYGSASANRIAFEDNEWIGNYD